MKLAGAVSKYSFRVCIYTLLTMNSARVFEGTWNIRSDGVIDISCDCIVCNSVQSLCSTLFDVPFTVPHLALMRLQTECCSLFCIIA